MKALVNYINLASVVFVSIVWVNTINAQTKFKTFEKKPIPIAMIDTEDPYSSTKLDYHDFKMQGEETWAFTKGDWYLKYKAMFDFRCKEPFQGGGADYIENDYRKSGYLFRLVDNQVIEDSIQFLLNKYYYNNNDTLRKWNLPPHNYSYDKITREIIKRLGLSHFKFVLCEFEQEKYLEFIDVPEAEQANDIMVSIYKYKYPADVDILLYDFEEEIWLYEESVTVSGDHELEQYVLQKFEPRYLNDCDK
jgi:hypothetical protein